MNLSDTLKEMEQASSEWWTRGFDRLPTAHCSLPAAHSPLPAPHSPQRSGATLVEVLVAIFVMALGMISILTLFPLGAVQMAQAIKDDRSAHAAANAAALANAWNLRQDVNTNFPATDPDRPSVPVYVDPIGYFATGGASLYVGGSTIRRVYPSFASNWSNAYRLFSVLDNIIFDTATATPKLSPSQFDRDTRYSFAYLLQRPRSSDSTVVTQTIVVYNQRGLSTGILGLPEQTHAATFNPTLNTITFPSSIPAVRPGEWLLDATAVPGWGGAHGYFYRVVGINQVGGVVVEVQQPIRGFPLPNNSFSGTVVVLEGIAEVFELGTGTMIP